MAKKRPIRVSSAVVTAFLIVTTVAIVCIVSLFSRGPDDRTETIELSDKDKLTVHFLDVGEGDCSLIVTPDGQTVMIDAGTPDCKSELTDQLRDFGVRKIDTLILTHSHSDHIGQAQEVIRRYGVKTLILPNLDDTDGFSDAINAALQAEAQIIRAVSPHTMELGEARLDFLFDGNDFVTDNGNSSIEVMLRFRDFSVLFTGDNEADVESYLLNTNAPLGATVLKVAHHGSDTSTTELFLGAVYPRYAVISVGAYNKYLHPDASVLDRLTKVCEKVFRTDTDGAVKLVTDGTNVKIYTYSSESGSRKAA